MSIKHRKNKAVKLLASLLTAACFHAGAIAAHTPVDISVNGNYIKTDAAPVIENGTVLAPVRAAANALGCNSVKWDQNSKTATLANNGKTIKITIGKNTALVNGRSQKLNSPARLINERTLVPIRFIAENFGADVSWDDKKYTVNIQKSGHSVPVSMIDTSYNENDLTWLAKIVHAEAEGESLEGKIGVANVILNRVDSNDFPDNIYDVIFDRNFGVQFTPILNGSIHNTPASPSYSAAKRALKGSNTVGESLYFLNPRIAQSFWIINNRTFYKSIGLHDFYL